MTKWESLAAKRERETMGADSALRRLWLRFQATLWPEMERLILGLAVDKAGRIVFSLDNIRKAARTGIVIKGVWQRQRKGVFGFLIDTIKKLFGLHTEYFREMGNVTETAEQRVLRRILEGYGYKDGKVLPGTLFDALAPGSSLTANISQEIQSAIATRMPLEQFRRQFFGKFINPQSGFAVRYYRQWTNDLFMQFDRGVAMAYADELGLNHAIYAGTMKDNTRDFCERRLNRVYTRDFIAAWNNQRWRGKHRLLPVELACGGYNCRHTLNYISEPLAGAIAPSRGGVNSYAEISEQ
jgi:hypothetical protein